MRNIKYPKCKENIEKYIQGLISKKYTLQSLQRKGSSNFYQWT